MRKIERIPNGSGIFRPGQDLVVAGAIAKAGARAALEKRKAELASRFRPAFLERLEAAVNEKLNLTPALLAQLGATEWEYIEEGGVLAALWNISGAYEQGISFSLLKMPVKQEIIEVCELFDLNPYRLCSGECVLIAANHGADMVQKLAEQDVFASVIGKVEKGIARKVAGIGGIGFLERPQPDEILKLEEEDYHAGKNIGDYREKQ